MPALADITVKKYDTVTNIVWTGIQPGAEATKPSIWQSASVGTAVAHRPELRLWTKNAGLNAKDLSVSAVYPSLSTDTTTSVTSIIGRQKFKGIWTLDQTCNQADINEFAAQIPYLLATAYLVGMLRYGVGTSG